MLPNLYRMSISNIVKLLDPPGCQTKGDDSDSSCDYDSDSSDASRDPKRQRVKEPPPLPPPHFQVSILEYSPSDDDNSESQILYDKIVDSIYTEPNFCEHETMKTHIKKTMQDYTSTNTSEKTRILVVAHLPTSSSGTVNVLEIKSTDVFGVMLVTAPTLLAFQAKSLELGKLNSQEKEANGYKMAHRLKENGLDFYIDAACTSSSTSGLISGERKTGFGKAMLNDLAHFINRQYVDKTVQVASGDLLHCRFACFFSLVPVDYESIKRWKALGFLFRGDNGDTSSQQELHHNSWGVKSVFPNYQNNLEAEKKLFYTYKRVPSQ